jgi:signal peptidase I
VTRTRRSLLSTALEVLVIVAVAVGVAFLVEAFLVKPYRIPSASMEPTLAIGQRILVNRLGAGSHDLHVGEIVVFHPPADYRHGCADPAEGENGAGQPGARACDVAPAHPSSLTFVKRVVGLPGDRILIRDGHVIRNGVREHDNYIEPCRAAAAICNFSGMIRIPSGDYFMMGDNRGESEDSRFWGPVRSSWIIGQVFFTYWPPDRIGFM